MNVPSRARAVLGELVSSIRAATGIDEYSEFERQFFHEARRAGWAHCDDFASLVLLECLEQHAAVGLTHEDLRRIPSRVRKRMERDVIRHRHAPAHQGQPLEAPTPTPDQVVAASETLQLFLKSLTPDDLVLLEFKFDGLSQQAIASMLGVSEATISRRLAQIERDARKVMGLGAAKVGRQRTE